MISPLAPHRAHSGGGDIDHFGVFSLHCDLARVSEIPSHRVVFFSGVGDVGPLGGLFSAHQLLAGVAAREVVDGLQQSPSARVEVVVDALILSSPTLHRTHPRLC